MPAVILQSWAEIAPWAERWEALTLPTPFARWAFVRDWLASPPRGARPFVILVTDDEGEPIALAPWCLVREPWGLRRVVGLWGDEAWCHDPWIKPGMLRQAVEGLVSALETAFDRWDVLDLVLRPQHGRLLLERLEALGKSSVRYPDERQSRLFEVGSDWEAYWAGRTKEVRANFRRRFRKLDVVPHAFLKAGREEAPGLLDELVAMHLARWGETPERRRWYPALRELAMAAQEREELYLYALRIGDRTAALNLILRQGNCAFGTVQVYDPEFAKLAVGKLLAAWAIEQLCREGVRVVDAGDGYYDWKEELATGTVETALLLSASPKSVTGRLYVSWQRDLGPRCLNCWRLLRRGLKVILRPFRPPCVPG